MCRTGPILRLERAGERLTKAQRYGHPCDRPIYSSSIPPSKMQVGPRCSAGTAQQQPMYCGWCGF
jgi:hypothetical protein